MTDVAEKDLLVPTVYALRVTHGWDGKITVDVDGIDDSRNSQDAAALALRLASEAVERGEVQAERQRQRDGH